MLLFQGGWSLDILTTASPAIVQVSMIACPITVNRRKSLHFFSFFLRGFGSHHWNGDAQGAPVSVPAVCNTSLAVIATKVAKSIKKN